MLIKKKDEIIITKMIANKKAKLQSLSYNLWPIEKIPTF